MKTDWDEGAHGFRVFIAGLLLVGAVVALMCFIRVSILRNFMHGGDRAVPGGGVQPHRGSGGSTDGGRL